MSLKDLCPRLIDYLVIVGSQNPNRSHILNQYPELLRRYPQTDHSDFTLPTDLVFFCQPEGCINTTPAEFNTTNKLNEFRRNQNSFIFTLTDKDKSKTRYGICVNFIRPIIKRKRSSIKLSDKDEIRKKKIEEFSTASSTSSTDLYKRTGSSAKLRPRTHSLTSLCIISHHPFFTKFRNCLLILLTILQKAHTFHKDKHGDLNIWSLLTGAITPDSTIPSLLLSTFREIEIWIYKLLSLPSPVPGKTIVNVQIQPDETIVFALPDDRRLSLVDFYLHLPFQLLGIEKTLKALTFILMEKKILVVSKNYCDLTVTIMSFITLLYPIQYMFPIILLLPTSMPDGRQILSAPSPFLIGVPDSFLKANVNIPNDIIIIDLDKAELTYSMNVPVIPSDEFNYLKEKIRQSIENLTPMSNCEVCREGSFTSDASACTDNFDWLIQSSDEESINISTRIIFINFFNSNNILGKFTDHTRTLRLYPRPVVTIHVESFLQSRRLKSEFIKELMKTQGAEYLAEWLTVPDNLAYQRIIGGVQDPKDIGDHYSWFKENLIQINCVVWNFGQDDHSLSLALDSLNDTFNLVSRKSSIGKRRIFKKNITKDEKVSNDKTKIADKKFHYEPTDESGSDSEPDQCTESDISTASEFASDYSMKTETPTSNIQSDLIINQITGDVPEKFYYPNSFQIMDTEHLPQHIIHSTTPSYTDIKSAKNSKLTTNSSDHAYNGSVLQRKNLKDSLNKTSYERKSSDNVYNESRRPKSLINTLEGGTSVIASSRNASINTNFSNSGFFLDKIFDIFKKEDEIQRKNGKSTSFDTKCKPDPNISQLKAMNRFSLSHEANLESVKNEIEDRNFMDTVLKEIEIGNTLSIFSGKNRFKNLMEEESSRNYVMSKIDKNLSTKSMDSRLPNYEIASWNKYKALEWLLSILMQGISQNYFSKKNTGGSEFSWLTRDSSSCIGGLASAYVVFEVAYTYFVMINNKKYNSVWNKQKSLRQKPVDIAGENVKKNSVPGNNDMVKSTIASLESTSINNEEYEVVNVSDDSNNFEENQKKIVFKITETCPDYETVEINGFGRFSHRKSSLSKGYRYCNGTLLRTDPNLGSIGEVEHSNSSNQMSFQSSPISMKSMNSSSKSKVDPKPERCQVPWTYLFQDLVLSSSNTDLLNDMQFWEEVFIDAVSQERDILGLDQNPRDLIEHYESLTELEKKNFELKEDRVIVHLLHNLIGFMVMAGLSPDKIKRKVRRLIAKCHTGLHYSQEINNLLDSLEYLSGNDIDLKPMMSRTSLCESFKVRNKNDPFKEDNFLELSDDCLLLRNIYGNIIDRWWYNRLTYITYKPPLLCLSRKLKDKTDMKTFITQDRTLYEKIKISIDKSVDKSGHQKFGVNFGEKINIIDLETNVKGTLEVTTKGFTFIFGNDKFTISLIHIDSCSISDKNVFIMKAINPLTKKFMTRKYETDFAHAVIYFFSTAINSIDKKNPEAEIQVSCWTSILAK